MPRLKKSNTFRLRRSIQYWNKSYDAPFVYPVYRKLLEAIKRYYPDIEWEEELALARQNIERVNEWGELPNPLDADRVYIVIDGHKLLFQVSKLLWCLIYPDYLLVTYPVSPPGKAWTMMPEVKTNFNPCFHFPSYHWHLPESVYDFFESIYGGRRPEGISTDVYDTYNTQRKRYCDYFIRQHRLPKTYFDRITGLRLVRAKPDLAEILSAY